MNLVHVALLRHIPAKFCESHPVRNRQATHRSKIEAPLIQPCGKRIRIFTGQNIGLKSGDVEALGEICGTASVEGYHCPVLQRESINVDGSLCRYPRLLRSDAP
jgi:hypothetical protein